MSRPMKGVIRRSKRAVWHIPRSTGDDGVIHSYCGWVYVNPERRSEPLGPKDRLCRTCARRMYEETAA